MREISSRAAIALLDLLALLFLARVAGQALVAFAGVTWLPPMASWYSGLLPYALLLPAQILVLIVQLALAIDARRGRGLFSRPRPRLGRRLRIISYVYAGAMLFRYIVTQTDGIPVAFHLVLATYLYVLGRLLVPEVTGTSFAACRSDSKTRHGAGAMFAGTCGRLREDGDEKAEPDANDPGWQAGREATPHVERGQTDGAVARSEDRARRDDSARRDDRSDRLAR
jgi:hypothetical protein